MDGVTFHGSCGRREAHLLRQLEGKWSRCSLRARHGKVRFDVLDAGILDG